MPCDAAICTNGRVMRPDRGMFWPMRPMGVDGGRGGGLGDTGKMMCEFASL